MTMKRYFLLMLIFLSVVIPQICQGNGTDTTMDSTIISSTMASTAPNPYAASVVSSTSIPNTLEVTTNHPLTSSNTINSSTYATLTTENSSTYATVTTVNSSTVPPTSSNTINSSTHGASMMTDASVTYVTSSVTSASFSSVTSQPKNVTYTLIYAYNINSSSLLQTGNFTNATILASVQLLVTASFNLTGFSITVHRVEIKSLTKSFSQQMLTENLFQTSRTDCDQTCINNSVKASPPQVTVQLQGQDGTLVNALATSTASLVDTSSGGTTVAPIINYRQGESPPGVAAQLGMGLGISFIGVLLIGEIVVLSRKYGLNSATRQSNYELPAYAN